MATISSREAAHGNGSRARRRPLELRVRFWHWRLDSKLAVGIDPASDPALKIRAEQLLDARNRHRLARDLRRLVAERKWAPAYLLSSAIPVVREQVAAAREMLVFVADVLNFADRVEPRGMATPTRLLDDGGSAVFVRSARGALVLELRAALSQLVIEQPAWADAWFLTSVTGDGGSLGQD